MTVAKEVLWGSKYNRQKCFFVGYLNLIVTFLDLGCHLLILTILTNGFECDINLNKLRGINWSGLETFLVVINIGTHGFYPFPLVLAYYDNMNVPDVPKCYPGMVHLYLIDLLNIFIHVVWLRLVISYVSALHKKDPEPMRLFFSLSVIKLILHLLYIVYKPKFYIDTYWFIQILDICVALFFLMLIHDYIKQLKRERASRDQPPPYIECLLMSQSEKPVVATIEGDKSGQSESAGQVTQAATGQSAQAVTPEQNDQAANQLRV